MSYQDYGPSGGYLWCDGDGCEAWEVVAPAGDTKEAERKGWSCDEAADKHLCPWCAEMRELPPAIEPEPGKDWQPVRGRIGGTVL